MATFEVRVGAPVTLAELTKLVNNVEGLGYKAGPIGIATGTYFGIIFEIPDSTK